MADTIKQRMLAYSEQVDRELKEWFAAESISPKLTQAMRYSVFNGGKRVRPTLVYAAARSIDPGADARMLDIAAAAVECIHAYSLIHDDLPAMDDDDLRRGQPTCHVRFDEATAILAGDALQTLAFEKLASIADEKLALSLVRELSRASGINGMVAGQVLDMDAEGQSDRLSLAELERVHKHKTGALIRAAARMGASVVKASEDQMKAISVYAEAIGLAFQVQDDIIDVCSDTNTLGKPQGSDALAGKSTYVSLLGLEQAQVKATALVSEAKTAIRSTSLHSDELDDIAAYIIERRH